jgi:uncharacterized membrane protein YgaE (UPF0421/DUF939 family)
MKKNKTSQYFKYAIGEIILVVIGILIALQINNWNQKNNESEQIRNIYARIVRDFANTAAEIDRDSRWMDSILINAGRVIKGDVSRDSLINSNNYAKKYFENLTGYPDIKINATGIRLLESKMELNYNLNNELTEALMHLYSEELFEIETDQQSLERDFFKLRDYITANGIFLDFVLNKNSNRFADMIMEDDLFKSYAVNYIRLLNYNNRNLKNFKMKGQKLIDQIIETYNLE